MTMLERLAYVALFLILLVKDAIAKNDYVLENEHLDTIDYDREILLNHSIHNFKYNRTVKAVNITFTLKTAPGPDLYIHVQAYRFASNEYRLFPVSFRVDACQVLSKNDFGLQNLYACGNFTGCPIKKGTSSICNWYPDDTKFPPNLPLGDYKVHLTALFGSHPVWNGAWYFKIKRKNLQ